MSSRLRRDRDRRRARRRERRRVAAADGGLSVAIVERELVGGECSYWGCIPSKTLIRPGDVLAAARRVPGARRGGHRRRSTSPPPSRSATYMTSDWNDAGQLPWLDEQGHHAGAWRRRGSPASAVVDVERADGAVRRLTARVARSCWPRARAPSMPPIPGLADVAPVGQPRRHLGQGVSRGGCSCSAAAPSAPRWPRPSSGSGARR